MKVLLIDQIAVVNYKYSFSLANELKRQGNSVELVVDEKDGSENCICQIYNKFVTSNKDVGKFYKAINYFKSFKFIVDKAIHEKFDIVHVQWFQFSPIDYFYLKKLKKNGIKLVVSVHDILPFNERFYDKYFHNKIYNLCNHVIVQAENNIERFYSIFNDFPKKVNYIPHGHFLDYVDVKENKEARNKFDIPENKIVLLFFGQIKKVKGLGVLLEAFGKICETRDDIFLIVAGNMWKDDFSPYQEIIDKYNLADHVKLDIRYIPDNEVDYFYSSCDIAVLPYLDVYQSGVIQLAYAYGKPTIATKIGAFQEIVKDGKTGFLCEANSSNDLMYAIEKAINHRDILASIGKAGQDLIREKYSWVDIAKNITSLYNLDSTNT